MIGREVLRVVDEEDLQARALDVGTFMLEGLRGLQDEHAMIGDVRGSGLFIGVELVKNCDTLEPAQEEASYIVNRLREHRILIGTDGPFDNVLKILATPTLHPGGRIPSPAPSGQCVQRGTLPHVGEA